jgi:hypothetical protein
MMLELLCVLSLCDNPLHAQRTCGCGSDKEKAELRVFFGDRIFERKIFEQNYSKALFCELFSTAMVLRKMFDAKHVRYRNNFDDCEKYNNFDAGVQVAAAP